MKIIDNSIDYIKSNQNMFLRDGNIGLQLSVNIISDALLLTDGKVTTVNKNNWWIVGSEQDWIKNIPDLSIKEIFYKIIPFPKAGQNSIHGEVLITAFAENVITVNNSKIEIIKGNLKKEDEFLMLLPSDNNWSRMVAFCMPNNM